MGFFHDWKNKYYTVLAALSGFVCFQAVMNRIHTISVPYAVMKACPLSWVQRVHIHKGKLHCSLSLSNAIQSDFMFNMTCHSHSRAARVALVKCRDLHWAMMAHRDQRDTSLASLRMLIVADGANPCEYFVTPSFVNLGLFKRHKLDVTCSIPYLFVSRVGFFL